MNLPHGCERSRRQFLTTLGLGLASAPFVGTGLRAQAASGRVRHVSFGTSGMAWADLTAIASHPAVDVVAGCDVDARNTAKFREKFPQARVYKDYRELLAQEKDVQSANVSTPDHMHAPIGLACMERGLHVYGQKPLTHDIAESRQMAELARARNLHTQMGIQIHSSKEYRTAVRLIQEGAVGKVREVHTWSNKKWGDGAAMPAGGDAVPETLDWNLWVGVCEMRPFIGNGWYHPGNWRKRLDFGTGTFGDMGCHIYDPVFKALALTAPLSVRSEGAAPNAHSWAVDAVCKYRFPGTAYTEGKTVDVTWYDGDQKPPREVLELVGKGADGKSAVPGQGSIFLGTEGVLVLPHVGMPRLVGPKVEGKPVIAVEGANHWHEFVDAVLGKGRCGANFDYAGPLTETVLLGSVASRFPNRELLWDAAALKFSNEAAANAHVRRAYRKA